MASKPKAKPHLRTCALPSCKVSFSATDSHPECYAHRSCPKTGDSCGKGSSGTCPHCVNWTQLQFEACRTRRVTRARQARHRTPPPAASSLDQLLVVASPSVIPELETPLPSLDEVLAHSPSSAPLGSPVPADREELDEVAAVYPTPDLTSVLSNLASTQQATLERLTALEARLPPQPPPEASRPEAGDRDLASPPPGIPLLARGAGLPLRIQHLPRYNRRPSSSSPPCFPCWQRPPPAPPTGSRPPRGDPW